MGSASELGLPDYVYQLLVSKSMEKDQIMEVDICDRNEGTELVLKWVTKGSKWETHRLDGYRKYKSPGHIRRDINRRKQYNVRMNSKYVSTDDNCDKQKVKCMQMAANGQISTGEMYEESDNVMSEGCDLGTTSVYKQKHMASDHEPYTRSDSHDSDKRDTGNHIYATESDRGMESMDMFTLDMKEKNCETRKHNTLNEYDGTKCKRITRSQSKTVSKQDDDATEQPRSSDHHTSTVGSPCTADMSPVSDISYMKDNSLLSPDTSIPHVSCMTPPSNVQMAHPDVNPSLFSEQEDSEIYSPETELNTSQSDTSHDEQDSDKAIDLETALRQILDKMNSCQFFQEYNVTQKDT